MGSPGQSASSDMTVGHCCSESSEIKPPYAESVKNTSQPAHCFDTGKLVAVIVQLIMGIGTGGAGEWLIPQLWGCWSSAPPTFTGGSHHHSFASQTC